METEYRIGHGQDAEVVSALGIVSGDVAHSHVDLPQGYIEGVQPPDPGEADLAKLLVSAALLVTAGLGLIKAGKKIGRGLDSIDRQIDEAKNGDYY